MVLVKLSLDFQTLIPIESNIDVDCKCDGDIEPISFSKDFLKEILSKNRDETRCLKISTDGLSLPSLRS